MPNDRTAVYTEGGRELVLFPTGDGYRRVSLGRSGDIYLPQPEQRHTVHFNQNHHVSVSGGGAEPWGAGVTEVGVTGEPGPGGDVGGGKGDRNGIYGGQEYGDEQ